MQGASPRQKNQGGHGASLEATPQPFPASREQSWSKNIYVQSWSKTAHNLAQIAKVVQPIPSYSGEHKLPRAARDVCVKASGGLSNAFAHNSYCCGDLGLVGSKIETQQFCEPIDEWFFVWDENSINSERKRFEQQKIT
jgi:hypothetical protein